MKSLQPVFASKKVKLLFLMCLVFASNSFANLSATAERTMISWPDTGGWMQVQNESTWETVPGCEGFITTCTAPAGSYKIVDHSSGIFQTGIQIDSVATPNIYRSNCAFQTYTFRGECEISCPAGMTIRRLVECRATVEASGLLQATDFNSDETTLFCRTNSISTPTTMNVGIQCE